MENKKLNSYFLKFKIIITMCLILTSHACTIKQNGFFNEYSKLCIEGRRQEALEVLANLPLEQVHEIKPHNQFMKDYLIMFIHVFRAMALKNLGRYNEALNNYESGFQILREIRNSDSGRIKYSLTKDFYALFVIELCFCSLQIGDTDYISDLTKLALGETVANGRLNGVLVDREEKTDEVSFLSELQPLEQYRLLNELLWFHTFQSGDMEACAKIAEANISLLTQLRTFRFIIGHPILYFWFMAEENMAEVFYAFTKLNSGDLEAIGDLQRELEKWYQNRGIKVLNWVAQQLGLFSDERAMFFGLGGYGYGMIGRYAEANQFFMLARSYLNEKSVKNNPRNQVILGALQVAHSENWFIPMNKKEEALSNLEEGIFLMKSAVDWTVDEKNAEFEFIGGGWWIDHFFLPYAKIVSAKLNYNNEQWDQCFEDASKAFEMLDAASARPLIIDSIYYCFSCLQATKSKFDKYPDFIRLWDQCANKLAGYKGYDIWKIYYIESYIHEINGHDNAAILSAKKSADLIEKFWQTPFPPAQFTQQITFLENKSRPYERIIELLLKSDLPEKEKTSEVFRYIEKLKRQSLQVSGKLESDAESSYFLSELTLTDLQECLSENDALIEFFYGSDYYISMFISSEKAFLIRSLFTDNQLKKEVDEFRQSLTKAGAREDLERHRKIGFELYKKTIGLHQKELEGKNRIFIVPHRKLHFLPWNALKTKPTYQAVSDYLIDDYDVAILPSAVILKKNKRMIEAKENIYRSSCCSFFIGPAKNGSPPIDQLINQTALEKSLGHCTFYSGPAANLNMVTEELARCDTVVIYGHGIFDNRKPLDSGIELSGNSLLSLIKINQIPIASSFVLLPGCDTGTVDRYTELPKEAWDDEYPLTDSLLGIYKALFTNGVENLVISLDVTYQESPVKFLLENILQSVNNGDVPICSFSKAIRKTKNDYNPLPHYWSPFIFVGR